MLFVVAWAFCAPLPLAAALYREHTPEKLTWNDIVALLLGGLWLFILLAFIADATVYDACGNGGSCSLTVKVQRFTADWRGVVVATAIATAVGCIAVARQFKTKR